MKHHLFVVHRGAAVVGQDRDGEGCRVSTAAHHHTPAGQGELTYHNAQRHLHSATAGAQRKALLLSEKGFPF